MNKYVEFKFEDQYLRGMLNFPENEGNSVPLIVFFHGFGGNKNTSNFSSAMLAKELEKNGIASVRFDFLGCGDSDGEFENMTISSQISQACAVLEFAKTIENVDLKRIGLYGLSLGGAIASAVASKKSEDVKLLCMCCPATNSVYEARNLKVKGQDVSSILVDGYFDLDGLKLGKGFCEDALNIDFYEMAKGFTGPVKLVHGDKDFIAPLENSKKYLALYPNATLEIVKNADHSFTSIATNEDRIKRVTDFFVKNLF